MRTFTLTTHIAAPPERCFDLARDIDAHSNSLPGGERAVAGVTTGLIGLGEQVTWEARHFGLPFRMTSAIVGFERPRMFADEQVRGPFGSWHHVHRFEQSHGGTTMTDDVAFRSPLGLIGRLVDALFLDRYMRKLMQDRNGYLKAEAERREQASAR